MAENIKYDSGRRWQTTGQQGLMGSILYPIAFYHLALMEYNPKRSLEEIVLFEKMLVVYRSLRLKPFAYQRDRLMKELHIKRDRLERAKCSLTEQGILSEAKGGKGQKIKYTINRQKVIEALSYLYKMPKEKKDQDALTQELTLFFTYWLTPKYLHDKIDPSIPDEVYEGQVTIVGGDKRQIKNMDENTTYKKEE